MLAFHNSVRSIALFLLFSHLAATASAAESERWRYGVKARMGGRYDNVRMCVATDPGVNGGPAMDISLSFVRSVGAKSVIEFDLPAMRPLLFGAAFTMVPFEPSVTLKFTLIESTTYALAVGPMLGVSLHYGPDKDSDLSGSDRTASFLAAGPMAGAYAGVTFKRPRGWFDLQVGVTLYGTPLFSIQDDEDHSGYVLGGSLDIGLLFR